MKILVGNNHLVKTGGTENYTYALALELKRQGHDVEYFTFEKGEVSALLEKEGVRYMSSDRYDLILANHCTVAAALSPFGYVIQTCHGVKPKLEQPTHHADAYVSISEEVQLHLSSRGFKSSLIYNGIDCERFRAYKPISEKLTSVLSLCQSDSMNDFLKQVCQIKGIAFTACNKHVENVWNIEELINSADLVVGIGRSIYDAMACGRCVIIYDSRDYMKEALGDGYLTEDIISSALKYNCSGRCFKKTFTQETFIEELEKYDSSDGKWARNYALKYFNIQKNVADYISIYEEWKKNKGESFIYKVGKAILRFKMSRRYNIR